MILFFYSCKESPKFRALTSDKTGIKFNNEIVETDSINLMKYEYVYNGGGVGIADFNNDGLQDIIFAGNQVSPKAYLNLGDFTFRDITSDFKGLTNDQWYSGVAVTDINNDGYPDIYLTSTANSNPDKRKNRLWVNEGLVTGEPVFTEMAEKYGIADTGFTVNAAFFDYDRDENPDLYILNNTVSSRMNTNYRVKMNDGSAMNNDRLYHNNGNGTFSDVTKSAGIVYEGFGLGLAFGDINKDGYPDIYVSNDFNSNDLLYINNGDGTFRNEIKKYMSYQSKSSMGNDMADINNDGNPDIFSLDMLPEQYIKRKQTVNGFSYLFYFLEDEFGYEHQYVRNMLHIHNGFLNGKMLPFSEESQIRGVYATDWSWSPLFADYDNDGDNDLLITNGFPKDETDKDWTRFKVTAAGFYASDQLLMDMAPAVKIPNRAFENMGGANFVQREDWLPRLPSFSYGAAFADLDNDGDLDYVVNNLDDEAFILRNYSIEKSEKHSDFIRIRLLGKSGNKIAIGAKVELWNKNKYQFSEHFMSRGYASSVDPVIHFGLGDEKSIDSVKVTWPATGNVTVLKNVKSNQTIEIDEVNSVPDLKPTAGSNENLLFNEKENILSYTHQQKDFSDYNLKQKILPHKFSQIGPRMAKGDLNGDGIEDLITGSTNTLPTSVFLRAGNKFKETKIEGLTTLKDFSEADIAIVDVDKDGDNDVIAVAGGYENKTENEFIHYLYENLNGNFVKKELPVPPFSGSVVRHCDFNHDGYPDLFIGSRIKKEMFPYATHSWLIINNKGKFSTDFTTKLDLGMVTDAIWSDYDNDGWEDLMVIREWNSVALMKNMNGKDLVPQIIQEIENKKGIWYSVEAADFNKDGYTDYIIGNIGEDNRFTASDRYPMGLYAIDVDGDDIIDPIITAYWKDQKGKMQEYPLNYLDELVAQSAFFNLKARDYASFSVMTIHDFLDEKVLQRLEFKLDVNTLSSFILWNDKGKFRWEKLPQPVQVSPVKKMIISDFNNDSYPDVLIGGNDYTYDVSTGNFDANKGLVLINKSEKHEKDQPSFDVVSPSQSGILLQGMVESLLWFKGDTSLVVAGFNRAKATVFEFTGKKQE